MIRAPKTTPLLAALLVATALAPAAALDADAAPAPIASTVPAGHAGAFRVHVPASAWYAPLVPVGAPSLGEWAVAFQLEAEVLPGCERGAVAGSFYEVGAGGELTHLFSDGGVCGISRILSLSAPEPRALDLLVVVGNDAAPAEGAAAVAFEVLGASGPAEDVVPDSLLPGAAVSLLWGHAADPLLPPSSSSGWQGHNVLVSDSLEPANVPGAGGTLEVAFRHEVAESALHQFWVWSGGGTVATYSIAHRADDSTNRVEGVHLASPVTGLVGPNAEAGGVVARGAEATLALAPLTGTTPQLNFHASTLPVDVAALGVMLPPAFHSRDPVAAAVS